VLILSSHEHVRQLEREAVAGPVLTGLFILVLTMLATTLVAHRIGRRMRNVGAHVARIAGGEFDPMPLDDRNDEIRDLSASVNRMGESLKSLTESIRESERTHLTAQVVGGLAHQIRNAITGIRMAIQVHRRRCAAGPDASLDVALTQIALTEQQIRGLLELTRNERRVAAPGRPRLLLEEIAAMIEPVCEHRRIEFSCAIDCPTDVTVSDADAFRSAVLNLCMNGVEAAGSQGEVGLTAALHSETLHVLVTDTGAGVPPDLIDEVFRPYFTTKPEGIGLGLSLVRQAAENLGGSVEVRRDAERTLFEFRCACGTDASATAGVGTAVGATKEFGPLPYGRGS
jgi:signal transduction histidine kinase